MTHQDRLVAGTRLIAATLFLGAWGWVSSAAAAANRAECASQAALSIPAGLIGLPTSGARVTAAALVPAAGSGPGAIGAYCQVSAEIAPVDPAAPKIKLIINLPEAWNGKGLMFGGGGYDGTIPDATGNVPAGPLGVPVPLARGYATFSSDSGHEGTSLTGSFGLNDEALHNFAGDALKKTRDVALVLMRHRYGDVPIRRMYFVGGSSGGREALAVVQRWPQDWDGIVAQYPAWNAATLDLQFGRITRALAAAGAYPNKAKRRALYDSAMAACDALDGAMDGLISDVAGCNRIFDPATATLDGRPLRCTGGADTGDTCLSDAQIAALKTLATSVAFDYPLGSGETQYPGFNIWGADLGLDGSNPQQPRVIQLALNNSQPAAPMPADAPFAGIFWDQWIKYFVTRDPNFDSLSVDPQNPGRWAARIGELAKIQDVNKTDLSAFRARGGKILLAHGSADVLVSTRSTEQYFRRLESTMGARRTRDFVRYYEIPGFGHFVSTVFNASWDSLGALENWVEHGQAPRQLQVADTIGVPGRTRPLCEFPSWPRYNGAGDVNKATSFVCVSP
jgi:feruloyl esterase